MAKFDVKQAKVSEASDNEQEDEDEYKLNNFPFYEYI